jgi:hypothetical protein
LAAFKRRLETQWDYLPSLWDLRKSSVAANPRSSHHLWTNLPHPQSGIFGRIARLFSQRRCIEQASRSGYALRQGDDTGVSSAFLEQAVTQLLFNPRYQPVVGYCLEFELHWDAPSDACSRLAAEPDGFLAQSGVLDEVHAVMRRRHSQLEAVELAEKIQSDEPQTVKPPPPLQTLLSFQCVIVEQGKDGERSERTFSVGGESFSARELRLDTRTRDADAYRHLAALLAPGFEYGRYLSEESPREKAAGAVSPEQLAGQSYALSRLEYLRDADIFIGHQWVSERPDLLAVYPYQVHVKNFVELFRRHYQSQRGRL